MRFSNTSITRRVICCVLGLELVAALALIVAVAIHERSMQSAALNANLRAGSNAVFGAVQEDFDDKVRLDLHDQTIPQSSRFRVLDDNGAILGTSQDIPMLPFRPNTFQHGEVRGRSYRFYTIVRERILDPSPMGGIRHQITIVYGLPDGHVWNEVFEAVRFFAVSTAVLLGATGLLMAALIRRLLSPIHALARSAEEINPREWQFNPPSDARKFLELRPLTLAIENTISRLHKSFQQQKRFTSDAAHELKTDLAIVKSSLQLLSMRERSVSQYQEGIAVGLDDVSRLERTIQKMLTLARLEQPPPAEPAHCRIDQIVLNVVDQSAPLAELKRVRVSTSMLENVEVPLSTEDATLLCSNILVNAIQNTPEHGTVHASVSAIDGRVHLSVTDDGPGVRQQELHLLFEPFYRGDPSRTRRTGGTGLGLAICKAICERAGGRISLSNRSVQGAIVVIELPVTSEYHKQVVRNRQV